MRTPDTTDALDPARAAATPHAPGWPAPAPPAEPWWWTASLVLLALALAAYRLAHTEADADLWGHLRFGLDLLDTRDITRPDIYSYLTGPSVPGAMPHWINHEWLAEALMALAWRGAGATGLAGVTGLIALKTLLGLGLAVLAVRHLRRQGLSLLAALFLTAYAMVAIYPGLRSLRPQAFTYLATLVVLLIMERASSGGAQLPLADRSTRAAPARGVSPRWRTPLWWTVPIMAIWVNLHGGFVAGLGLLGIWWGSRAVASVMRLAPGGVPRRELARDALVIVAASAATLANPYGWHLWTFLARTLTPRPEISEWTPVALASSEGFAYLLVAALGIVGLLSQPPARRVLTAPLLAAGLLLPFIARRHLPLLVFIVLVGFAADAARACGAGLHRRWPRLSRGTGDSYGRAVRFRPMVAGALVAEAVVLLLLSGPEWTRIVMNRAAFPILLTRNLRDAGITANLAVFFNWGEYVLWHTGPRIKVSVDGRRETVYSDEVYAENLALTDGVGEWDRLLRRRPTDLALVSLDTPAAALLARQADWELIAREGPAVLYARRGTAAAAALRRTWPPAVPGWAPGSAPAPSSPAARSPARPGPAPSPAATFP